MSTSGLIPFPEYEFSSDLGWSFTRRKAFESCKRRYWYDYYNRWDPEIERESIMQLKGLSSTPMLIGEVVHILMASIAKRLLRSRAEIDRDRFNIYARKALTNALNNCDFQEIHFGHCSEISADELWLRLQTFMESYLSSDRYRWLHEEWDPEQVYLIDPDGYGETRLAGMKIYAKPDLLVHDEHGMLIIDWKTGRRDASDHSLQVAVYAAWAREVLEQPASKIRVADAYLKPPYCEETLRCSESELDAVVKQVRSERASMQAMCIDVVENKPLEKEKFHMTEDTEACRLCNYRELCHRI